MASPYQSGYSSSFDSRWNPRSWSRKVWIIVVSAVIVVVVVIIGVAVGVSRSSKDNKSNAYPDYSKLNYTLLDTYSGTGFFDKFDYFHDYDPAGGFVHYVNPEDAKRYNLTHATSSTALIRVDTTVGPGSTPDASTGRFSVRLESKTQYGPGLFLFDVKHTPYGCGTWPALWLTDPNNWPANGEIDIMEAVNQATTGNLVALHTTDDCAMTDIRREMSGSATGLGDCHNATDNNAGCAIKGGAATYGPDFNAAGGGIVALEWRNEGIRVWVFSRGQAAPGLGALPGVDDKGAAAPDPSSWGKPLGDFPSTNCDVASHFRNQSIVVNIDLCGYFPEGVWADSGCGPSTCTDYVAKNPSAFTNAYWEFGAFQVWKSL